jgi:hypothetical protein
MGFDMRIVTKALPVLLALTALAPGLASAQTTSTTATTAEPAATTPEAKPATTATSTATTTTSDPVTTATIPAAPVKPKKKAKGTCVTLGFEVNDYGKDGPTKDAKSLLDAFVVKWAAANAIKTYKVGEKSVNCELFLDFGVFDEHTCTASANVCWQGGPKMEALVTPE